MNFVLFEGRRFPLDQRITLGRAVDCEIVIRDASIARRHCVLRPEGGACWVEDLGSSGGLFLDGQRFSKGLLAPGVPLFLGRMQVTLEHQPGWWVYLDDRPVKELLRAVHIGPGDGCDVRLLSGGSLVLELREDGPWVLGDGEARQLGGDTQWTLGPHTVALRHGDPPPPPGASLERVGETPERFPLSEARARHGFELHWVGDAFLSSAAGTTPALLDGVPWHNWSRLRDGSTLTAGAHTFRLWLDGARPEHRDAGLEQAIADSPTNRGRWLVYADALEEHGDPWAERIREERPRTWNADCRWRSGLGALTQRVSVDWDHGFARRLVLRGPATPGQFAPLLAWAGARFLRVLELNLLDPDDAPLPHWSELFAELGAAEVPRTLERLTFGAVIRGDPRGPADASVKQLLERLQQRAPHLATGVRECFVPQQVRGCSLVSPEPAQEPLTFGDGDTHFLCLHDGRWSLDAPDRASRRYLLAFDGHRGTLRTVDAAPEPIVDDRTVWRTGGPYRIQGSTVPSEGIAIRHLSQLWLGDACFRVLID